MAEIAGRRDKETDRSLPRSNPLAPLQSAHGAGVLVLDSLVRPLPWQEALGRDGRGGGDGVSQLARDRAQRRGGDAEPGALGASLPLSEGARARAAVAGGSHPREAPGARAGGAHGSGGAAAALAAARHEVADGGAALWRRPAAGGVPRAANE